MKDVAVGVIGTGSMGSGHARRIAEEVPGATLSAVCNRSPESAKRIARRFGCRWFANHTAMLNSGIVDAVLIATPHYSHVPIGIDALTAGVHVLVEKPVAVHKADSERLAAAHTSNEQVFAAGFNLRTQPLYRTVKRILDNGELGQITRLNWIMTTWFRTDEYYRSAGWRATWGGEGGGVLLNQCSHQLDLLQWFGGMPKRITAFTGIGKYHRIEVEDEVTAHLEYPNGATGVFVASTAESPGTDRLEICGEMGKLVVENGSIHFTRNDIGRQDYLRSSKEKFGRPPAREVDISLPPKSDGHTAILHNFVDAIRNHTPPIAPAREGINSVELSNAMLLSGITGRTVEIPIDGEEYERFLMELVRRRGDG